MNDGVFDATAWSAVAARLAGAIFFVGFQSRRYHVLGYFDLTFFVPEAILLTLALRGAAQEWPVVKAV